MEIVDLLAHLFHQRFCPAENVPDAKKPYVATAYFTDWLEAHLDMMDADEICEAAEVSPTTWEKMREMSANGRLFSALVGIWFTIVLKDRIGPSHKLLRVVSSTLLTSWCGSARGRSATIPGPRHSGPLPCAAIWRRFRSPCQGLGLARLRTRTIQHGRRTFIGVTALRLGAAFDGAGFYSAGPVPHEMTPQVTQVPLDHRVRHRGVAHRKRGPRRRDPWRLSSR